MDVSDYLGYIAHFVKNIDLRTPDTDLIAFLTTALGKKATVAGIISAPLPKVRDAARLLYQSYVVSMYTKYGAFYLASKLDAKTMSTYLTSVIAQDKKFGVFYNRVDYDFTPAVMDSVIKKFSLPNYKAIFTERLGLESTGKVGRTTKAKPQTIAITRIRAPKKTPVRGGKKSPAKKPKSISIVDTPTPPTRGKKGKVKGKARTCKDYKVPELKALASALKIPGASRMKKPELCKVLGV